MPPLPASPTVSPLRNNLRTSAAALAFGLALNVLLVAPVRADGFDEANQSFRSGQHAKALEQINRHLSTKPKDAQGRFLKGIILTGMNKQSEAIAVFQKLTEDYPELPEPYNNLAVIYAQQKQYEKAKQALEMAIRTHPAYATAHENLGDIYSRLASQAYGKALQIDASNASAQTKLAMIDDLVGSGKVGAGKTAGVHVVSASQPTPPVTAPVAPPPTVVASVESKPAEQAKPPATPKPAETKPVETKPAEAKPAPKPEPVVKPEPAAKPEPVKSADMNSEITASIDDWLAAWARKDVKTYLAHYARDFQTPDGQSRKEWETDRSQRVGKPGKIEVGRDKLSIKSEGTDKAVVRFRQNYKSASFSSSSGKMLVLVKRDGKWLIQQERVGG